MATTILPTTHTLTGYSIPVTFPSSGTYTLRLTETGTNENHGAIVDNISIIACFVSCTHIETKAGPCLIEDLLAGDLVRTKDHGFQPVRWGVLLHVRHAAIWLRSLFVKVRSETQKTLRFRLTTG